MAAQVLCVLDIELVDRKYVDVSEAYAYTKSLIGVMTQEEEVIALLQSKSVQEYERIISGLLFGFLAGEEWVRYLAFTNRDQYQTAAVILERLLPKLRSYERAKFLLLEMWRQNSPQLHSLLTAFMRVADLSSVLSGMAEWICAQPAHFPSFVFFHTLKRAYAHNVADDQAMQEDIHLLSQLWAKRRGDCMSCGKETLLMITNICAIQELEFIFTDLHAAGGAGVLELLRSPTPWIYQSLLLDPATEEKVKFVLEKVTPAQYHRYMLWVVSGLPEHHIPDIVRYILTYQNTAVNIQNRWKLVVWLLNFSSDREVQAHVKFAFVFDLLFFNEAEGTRLIEPLMGFIQTSTVQKPELVDEVLHFLVLAVERFQGALQPIMTANVKSGFRFAETQGIISPLETLLREGSISPDVALQVQALLSHQQQMPPSPELELSETDEEEVSLSLPESVFTVYGEAAKSLAVSPSIDRVRNLLHLSAKVEDPLADFVLKCIMQELVGSLTQFVAEDSLLFHLFQAAEHDLVCRELIRLMRNKETGVGVRLLVFSARTGSTLYQSLDPKDFIEKDLQAGMLDMTLETLTWLFPYVFEHMGALITPSIVRFFLQMCTPELLAKVEFDLILKKYSLIEDKVRDVLEMAGELSNVEQLYLWKLIVLEVPGEKITEVVESVYKCVAVTSHWEMLSGLVTFLSKWPHMLTSEHAKMLLMFPSKHFAQAIYIALSFVKPSTIEEAILSMMQKAQFHSQINVLRHIKYWFENGLKLRKVVKSRAIQEILGTTLQSLSSEYFKEFSGVLETSRPSYDR